MSMCIKRLRASQRLEHDVCPRPRPEAAALDKKQACPRSHSEASTWRGRTPNIKPQHCTEHHGQHMRRGLCNGMETRHPQGSAILVLTLGAHGISLAMQYRQTAILQASNNNNGAESWQLCWQAQHDNRNMRKSGLACTCANTRNAP